MNSNTVEFVIRMRDMMSSSLNRLGSATQSTFSRMSQHADRMNQRNQVLSQSYDQIQQRIRQVEQTVRSSTIPNQIAAARRELASLQSMANNHPGNMGGSASVGGGKGLGVGGVALGSMIGGIATQAGSAFIDVVKDGIGAAISGSMQKEKAITGLSTFLGKQGASEAYANIRQDAQISPYGTESLLEVNRALISAGENAKNAREDSMNLANAISAVGGGDAELSRMAANMQQIRTVGKATAMDIKQFGMVGINIYEMLSRSTGKSIAQVKEMDVTYDDLAKSFAMARSQGGIYAGALEAMSQTRQGKLDAIKDQAKNALVDIGDALSPIIIMALDLGQKVINYITPGIAKITPIIKMISDVLGDTNNKTTTWGVLIQNTSKYFGVVFNIVKTVIVQLYRGASGIMEWVNKSVLIQDIFKGIYSVIGAVLLAVGFFANKITWIWDNVLKPILNGIESAYRWVKELVTGKEVKATVNHVATSGMPASPTSPSYSADLTRFGKSTIASGDETAKKNKEKSKATGETISGGGPKTINITVGKFFDSIQFTTMNGNESAEKLEQIVTEVLGRVLYNGAKMI